MLRLRCYEHNSPCKIQPTLTGRGSIVHHNSPGSGLLKCTGADLSHQRLRHTAKQTNRSAQKIGIYQEVAIMWPEESYEDITLSQLHETNST